MAAAGVVVLLRKRWIRMELMMGVESDTNRCQGHSGRSGTSTAGRKKSRPGRPVWAFRVLRDSCLTAVHGGSGETTTTGISPAISGATQYSPCFECSRLVDLSLLNLAHSSQQLTSRNKAGGGRGRRALERKAAC